MQPPLIFVATADPAFENIARNAILDSYHGLRCVRDIREACQSLGMGTRDIALAIIDLDLHDCGRSLLHILGGCEPDFPILAVVEDESLIDHAEIARVAIAHVVKPISRRALQCKIEELCRDSSVSHSTCSGRHLQAA